MAAEQQLVPYKPAGRDYVCALCERKIPDGAHVNHGQQDGHITWVQAVDTEAPPNVLHECGEVPGG
jgi:hypothetical protein